MISTALCRVVMRSYGRLIGDSAIAQMLKYLGAAVSSQSGLTVMVQLF